MNERLAKHYGIPNVFGSHFRRVRADRRDAAGPARQRRRADGHLARDDDVAGAAGQMDAREPDGRAAAAAAARRAGARRNRGRGRAATMREQMEQHRANADLRGLSQVDGSDRIRAGELRRRRHLADDATSSARRAQYGGRDGRRHKIDGVDDAAPGAAQASGRVRRRR